MQTLIDILRLMDDGDDFRFHVKDDTIVISMSMRGKGKHQGDTQVHIDRMMHKRYMKDVIEGVVDNMKNMIEIHKG